MALRWFLALTLVSSLCLPVTAATAQTLDQYGGYTGLPAPGGATGFFRLEKIGNRWTFVTPAGNAFWLRAVYDMGGARGGTRYRNAILAKYPVAGTDANQSMKRLRAWGFNAIGEYANMHWLPLGTYGAPGIAEKLPFLFVMNGSYYGMNAPDGTKNIFAGVNRSINPSIYIGRFTDVFDPRFATGWSRIVASQLAAFNGGASAVDASPWYIGSTTDDGDYTTGFGPGPDGASSQGKIHPHLGWIAAVTNPAQAGYTDTKVYTKYALRDFLAGKYGTVAALNAAWGSTYTTFDSAGGWGTGTGFLDEDGRHAWIGTNDGNYLKTASAGAKADLDTFLGQIANRYFSVSTAAIRAALPHHLVFSPASMQAGTRPQILQAAGPYLDAIQSSGVPLGASYPLYQKAYNLTGKPLFIWTTFTAQADADLLGTIPPGWGTGYYDHPTQGARGIAYASDLSGLLNLQGADGAFFVAGIDWWEWTDTTTSGENMNFGLVTNLDNVYDGLEAIIARGVDPWGYPTGGEPGNYGGFLDSVKLAHSNIAVALGLGVSLSSGAAAVSITSPTSGSTVQQTVTVSAAASSSAVRMDLALDGSLMGSFGGTTAQYPWNTTTSTNSTHRWVAKAYDSSGASVSSSPVDVVVSNTVGNPDTTPPVVSITQPTDGGSVARKTKTTIQATASDNVGVTRVEFYVNGSLKCSVTLAPYACQWQVPASSPGSGKAYRLQAKAYDAQGNVGSSSIVTVQAQ